MDEQHTYRVKFGVCFLLTAILKLLYVFIGITSIIHFNKEYGIFEWHETKIE